MALSNTKIIVSAETVVNGVKVATYTSTINTGSSTEVSVTSRYLDKNLYDNNKTTIETDRDDFVAYVRGIQSSI